MKIKLLTLLVAITLLSSCTRGRNSQKDLNLRTNLLSFALDDEMDPSKLVFVQSYTLLDNLADKLFKIGPDGAYRKSLAQDIVFSNDKKTISIEIKQAYFSDGTPITSYDVAASLKRAAILGTPHTNIKHLWLGSKNLKKITDDIPGIKVNSDRKLTLKLTRETRELLYFFTMVDLSILHPSQYIKEKTLRVSDWTQGVSGPYVVKTTGDILTIEAVKTHRSYRPDMPQLVTFEGYKGHDVIEDLRNQRVDLGIVPFGKYLKNIEKTQELKNYSIFGNETQGLIHLVLNTESRIFRDERARQWLHKKIQENLKTPVNAGNILKRAFQFFPPNAKGFSEAEDLTNILSKIDSDKIPDKLKDGITIRTIKGMKDFVPRGLEQRLQDALGIPVKIQFKDSGKEYSNIYAKNRDFDVSIIAVAVSYKIIGEALNLQYRRHPSLLTDPSKKIGKLLEIHQSQEKPQEERKILNKIVTQMIKDSESIPLFYYSSPIFIRNTIDISKLNHNEFFHFANSGISL